MKNKLAIGTILISSLASNVYAQLSSEALQIIQSKRQQISQIDQVVRSNATESALKIQSSQTQTGQTQTGNRIVLGAKDSTNLGGDLSALQYIAKPIPVNGGSIFVGNCSPATKPTSTKPALCPTGLTGTAEMSRNVSCFDGNWNAGPWLVNDVNYGNCTVPADCFLCDGTINPTLSFSRKAACQTIADGSSSRGLGTVNLPNCIVPTPATLNYSCPPVINGYIHGPVLQNGYCFTGIDATRQPDICSRPTDVWLWVNDAQASGWPLMGANNCRSPATVTYSCPIGKTISGTICI